MTPPTPLRVLLVEDSTTDEKLILARLRAIGRPIESARVQTGPALEAALSERSWDVVLSDWSLPSFSALAALAVVKRLGLDVPFIIVSGTVGEEHAVAAMRLGAHDYVLKDHLARLVPAVEREIADHALRQAHRQAQRASYEAERRAERMIASASVGVWLVDTAGDTTYMNARMASMLGLEPAEATAARLGDLLPALEGGAFADRIERLRATATGSSELELRRKDGSLAWGLLEASPLYATTGELEGVLCMVSDITERKRADSLRAAVVDAALDAIVGMDHAGRITEFNAAAEALFGRPRDAVMGTSLADLMIPARLRAAHAAGLARYLATGVGPVVGRRIEVTALRADGTELPVELAIKPVGAEQPPRFIGFLRDLTAKKAAERALRERATLAEVTAAVGFELSKGDDLGGALQRCAEAFVARFEGAHACICTLDASTHELVPRARAGPQLHAEAGSVCGPEIALVAQGLRPLFVDDIASDRRFDDAAPGGRPGSGSFAGLPLLVGGTLVGVLAIYAREPPGNAVRDGLGTIADGIALGIHREVVQQANVDLEAQLRQSQKMEAVGRLAGGVAHDFNNLLSVVLSYSDLLLREIAPGVPMRQTIEEIRDAGQRAATLTRQLLMFSRQNVMAPRILDLDVLLAEMTNMIERLVGEDVALVIANGAAPLAPVRVDRGGVEQIIMNLVVNARDAMPTGGHLRIETANVVLDEAYARSHVGAKPGPHVRLRVADDGTGMPPEVQAQVFEPFFTTKGAASGTGLGLSTVFGIVQQNEGSIWVESELGRGTAFDVFFPHAADVAVAKPTPPPSNGIPGGTETILLVEDADGVRAVAQRILARAGYQVVVASGGEEALALVERHTGTIDLLLTDVVMPGMSGPELAKRLGARLPALKVLCMSGYTDDSIVRHGVLSAELAFLPKPFTPATLASKVREVLDR